MFRLVVYFTMYKSNHMMSFSTILLRMLLLLSREKEKPHYIKNCCGAPHTAYCGLHNKCLLREIYKYSILEETDECSCFFGAIPI